LSNEIESYQFGQEDQLGEKFCWIFPRCDNVFSGFRVACDDQASFIQVMPTLAK
jgi:hypothetical protein